MRPRLLFLAHRIPYPPNKGDKIRAYHLLSELARHYRVHLGTFVDAEQDVAGVEPLRGLCEEVEAVRLRPSLVRVASARGLLTGEPLTVPYYRSRRLARWVAARLGDGDIGRALVYSSGPAAYLLGERYARLRRVIDFVDVDSDKWAQYAEGAAWPMRAVYQREARRLLAFERRVAREFDAGVFVSAAEAALFRRLCPEAAGRIWHASNGVDAGRFDPALALPDPYPPGERALVFTGAMDYWPNVDAVCWFANEVLPRVLAARPDVALYVVGANPTEAVRRLAARPGCRVTGQVADVRPYLRHAAAAVAPLRIARGIQNKVLEAMAMARPTVVTPAALEGIAAEPGAEVLLGESPADLASQVLAALADSARHIGERARRRVLADFDWATHLAGFVALLEGDAP
jgi:sugar transferase (PEP-CTERM/EpsH1 system associated)